MIYGPNTSDLYLRQLWNSKEQARRAGRLESFFSNTIDNGAALNSLNLTRVFVIGTGRTASASELIINGLDPYVEVIHIGSTTTGKNEFSISLVDDPANRYGYNPERENLINPNNKWILQPLVGRNENAVGFFDYTAGFQPDVEQLEDVFNLGTFGDPGEPLLARTLELISGVSTARVLPAKQKQGSVNFSESVEFLEKPFEIMDMDLNR